MLAVIQHISNRRDAYLDVAMFVRVLGASSDWGFEIIQVRCIKENRLTMSSYEMVHPNVDPGHQIFLRDILPVEKLVKVDWRRSGQVQVPHAARRGLCVLATRNSEIVACPVGVMEKTLGAYDGLGQNSQSLSCRKKISWRTP